MKQKTGDGWQFWADQGGTFTDLVGLAPNGDTYSTKVLSASGSGQAQAVERGLQKLLKQAGGVDKASIDSVRIGTTLGTNALLQRRTARTALIITAGFADLPQIGYQQRPDLFALAIEQPPPVYNMVVEVAERLDADGRVLMAPDEDRMQREMEALKAKGVEALAICLLHAWRNPVHERKLQQIAKTIGFERISVSHEILPQIRMVGRADTTVADAALSPILQAEFAAMQERMKADHISVFFMQSDGLLATSDRFRGCDSVLSGPAGGVMGGIAVAQKQQCKSVIGFDMGGTSTDVWHWDADSGPERQREIEIGGCRILTPTMDVRSIAAGGGSILHRHLGRMQVGPSSAGADPGPACYGRGGPATVTDANFCTGRLLPEFFPALFGNQETDLPDAEAALLALKGLLPENPSDESIRRLADSFLEVACDRMAKTIKQISMMRGYDPADSTLLCLGGAAGQHACRVAERLDMKHILTHPMSGVMSALGIGMTAQGAIRRRTLNLDLKTKGAASNIEKERQMLCLELQRELELQGLKAEELDMHTTASLLYAGTDIPLDIPLESPEKMMELFGEEHAVRYGYRQDDRPVLIESLAVEMRDAKPRDRLKNVHFGRDHRPDIPETTRIWRSGKPEEAAVLRVDELGEEKIKGPALLFHPQFTLVVEPKWHAFAVENGAVLLEKPRTPRATGPALTATLPDESHAARLELFLGLFGNVAERMGATLRQTAESINIRERQDYSCALFNAKGDLIANAPHIPVHIGSMSECIRSLIAGHKEPLKDGDYYAGNTPYNGGTHLPDITVMTALSTGNSRFFLAVRGHHAEIGGEKPGSMPAHSTQLAQEGVLFDNCLIETDGQFLRKRTEQRLLSGDWPSRDPATNLKDLQAQIAACRAGCEELRTLVQRHGETETLYWSDQVLDSGEQAVRSLIAGLAPGEAKASLENGADIVVRIRPDHDLEQLNVDFCGTAGATPDNFNAPGAVTRAVVLYVLRCLIKADIPLNDGCMRPVRLIIPEGSVLAARYPSAVVAGNVETSQAVCNLLLRALGVQAGSQGTMNNLTFGNENFQYYETLAGGGGALPDRDGADAVHTHMTNSRLTDPEILESRFPVRVTEVAVRRQSGGSGRYRGGEGMVRQIEFLTGCECSIISSSRTTGGQGLCGGCDGAAGRNLHIRAGERTELPACTQLRLQPGDSLRLETPGGGGFSRPPE